MRTFSRAGLSAVALALTATAAVSPTTAHAAGTAPERAINTHALVVPKLTPPGGAISRDEIISRARFWVQQAIPYSQSSTALDPQGRSYRSDCSGMVSMALHLDNSYGTAWGLPDLLDEISPAQLQPGDVVGKIGPGTGGDYGHVMIFAGWVNQASRTFVALEETSAGAGTARQHTYTFGSDWFLQHAYRYQHVLAQPSTPPAPRLDRVGFISGKKAVAREGSGPWVDLAYDAVKLSMSGNRIGIVTDAGNAYVKEGGVDAPFVLVDREVKDIRVTPDRIAVLHNNDVVLAKEGSIYAGWVNVGSAVTDFEMDGKRLAIVQSNGEVRVKEGGLDAGWVLETDNARDVDLAGNRIAVTQTNGALNVKEGGLFAGWITVAGAVAQADLDGSRIGIVQTNGNVLVKEGPLNASWVTETGPALEVKLAGDRIAVRYTNNAMITKVGSLWAGWTALPGTADVLQLNR